MTAPRAGAAAERLTGEQATCEMCHGPIDFARRFSSVTVLDASGNPERVWRCEKHPRELEPAVQPARDAEGEGKCPNPHCENGLVRGTKVGCAICSPRLAGTRPLEWLTDANGAPIPGTHNDRDYPPAPRDRRCARCAARESEFDRYPCVDDKGHRLAGDAAALRRIAAELLGCAESWEPDVCLLGNVRAREIASLCRAALASRPADAGRGETATYEDDYWTARQMLDGPPEQFSSHTWAGIARQLCRMVERATARPTGEGAGPHPTETEDR